MITFYIDKANENKDHSLSYIIIPYKTGYISEYCMDFIGHGGNHGFEKITQDGGCGALMELHERKL
jgi:hypothetical protein